MLRNLTLLVIVMDLSNSSQMPKVFVIQASPMIAAQQIGNINKDDAKNKTWNETMNLQLVNCCLAHKVYSFRTSRNEP